MNSTKRKHFKIRLRINDVFGINIKFRIFDYIRGRKPDPT